VGRFHRNDHAVDSGEVRDIQNDPMSLLHAERFKILQSGFTAHGTYDTVARSERFLRQSMAKATAHARDE
jgi:hypothetical protein